MYDINANSIRSYSCMRSDRKGVAPVGTLKGAVAGHSLASNLC